ncbi:hypothetical protein KQH27_01085 [bacterium]|nr:hypothetical protein [bacterium]
MESSILSIFERIFNELDLPNVTLEFNDFQEISRDPIKKAEGYDSTLHAKVKNIKQVVEINTRMLNSTNFYHWRNWENILAHEAGHIIIDTPMVNASHSPDYVGMSLMRYQYELYNIAQDMTIPNCILPKKYTNFDLSRINPIKRYSEARKKVRTPNEVWSLKLELVKKLPFWFAYGHYDKGDQGKRILNEIDRIVSKEKDISSIAHDTERLVKPYSEGRDCRNENLQTLVNKGLEYFKMWTVMQGKW